MTHILKIEPEYYRAVASGQKTFELRKNDRNYQRGDVVVLKEHSNNSYTGGEINAYISYVFVGGSLGLEKDYCILGIKLIDIKTNKT